MPFSFFSFLFFFFLLGASRRPAFLRFRTNDVLLGTSGVGVRFSVVSIQLFRPVIIIIIIGYIAFESTSLDLI